MRTSRWWPVCLGLAGINGCAMALYHFVLPYHMNWQQGLVGVPDSLVWALYALNFSWSLLVLLAEGLVLYAAKLGPAAGGFARCTVFTMGLFWAIHGAYTWLSPLPLPPSMLWLRYLLGLFPLIVVLLHWVPLIAYRGWAGATRGVMSETRGARVR